MFKPKVINLFGGPSSGKSTAMAGLFYLMKVNGHSVEMTQEYLKPFIYNNEYKTIINDQLFILNEQNNLIFSYYNSNLVEYIITDAPLLMSIVYNKNKNIENELKIKVKETINKYNNINIFINRTNIYNNIGRLESFEDAKIIDEKIKNIFNEMDEKYDIVYSSRDIDKTLYNLICVNDIRK